MNQMDLVYIVRDGEDNPELRVSLRSIAKFAPESKIWIIGYKPRWLSDEIPFIPRTQVKGCWANARCNIISACRNPQISENFILMNDDFILTRPIKSWRKSISKAQNTIDEQIAEWSKQRLISRYTTAFSQLRDFFKGKTIYNYELHIPMIINKQKFLNMFTLPKVQEFIAGKVVFLYRSLYGNLYKIKFNELINDVKFYNGDPKRITTEWISVFDGWVDNMIQYPKLNKFIQDNFSEKCRYEKRNERN